MVAGSVHEVRGSVIRHVRLLDRFIEDVDGEPRIRAYPFWFPNAAAAAHLLQTARKRGLFVGEDWKVFDVCFNIVEAC